MELLAHPELKAGLTHCGFGGVLEFIGAGKLIVALPHFADQPQNAVMLEKLKVAVILYNINFQAYILETFLDFATKIRFGLFSHQIEALFKN